MVDLHHGGGSIRSSLQRPGERGWWIRRVAYINTGGHLLKYKISEEKDFYASQRIFLALQELKSFYKFAWNSLWLLDKGLTLAEKSETTEVATYCFFFLYVAFKTLALTNGDFSHVFSSSLQNTPQPHGNFYKLWHCLHSSKSCWQKELGRINERS